MRLSSGPQAFPLIAALLFSAACNEDNRGPMDPIDPEPMEPTVEVIATGLLAPQGIELDDQGRLWIAEQGTGADDGRISVLTPDGTRHTYVDQVPSNIVQGSPEGIHHILVVDDVIWSAAGFGEDSPDGILLRDEISGYTPGDPPDATGTFDDVGTFVLAADPTGTGQTNIYNLTAGPGGDIYIVDASANAVIRREAGSGDLSVFATLPGIENSSGVGPPVMQAVPTGIVFDGSQFLVSAFPGFPFVEGAARVFAVDLSGNVTTLHEGLTSAVDLTFDPSGNLVVLEYATGFMGDFAPNTGAVVRLTGGGEETLISGLNTPAGIRFAPDGSFYVSDFAGGRILKVTP